MLIDTQQRHSQPAQPLKWTVFAIKVVLYTKIEQVLRMTNVFGSFG